MTSSWSSNLKKYAKPPFFEANSRLRMSLSEFCGERLSFVAISFYCCRYFLGHVACRNLPLQGLISVAYSPLEKRPADSCYSHD